MFASYMARYALPMGTIAGAATLASLWAQPVWSYSSQHFGARHLHTVSQHCESSTSKALCHSALTWFILHDRCSRHVLLTFMCTRRRRKLGSVIGAGVLFQALPVLSIRGLANRQRLCKKTHMHAGQPRPSRLPRGYVAMSGRQSSL